MQPYQLLLAMTAILLGQPASGMQIQKPVSSPSFSSPSSRRDVLRWTLALGSMVLLPSASNAASAVQDSMDVDSFLRSGVDIGGPMGVSSQAGKSKPETGIYLRYDYTRWRIG